MTARLKEWLEKKSLRHPFTQLAEETGVGDTTIRSVFDDYREHLRKTVRFETPEILGIDEVHLIRRSRAGAFPGIPVVVDKFHVVKMANAALDSPGKSPEERFPRRKDGTSCDPAMSS